MKYTSLLLVAAAFVGEEAGAFSSMHHPRAVLRLLEKQWAVPYEEQWAAEDFKKRLGTAMLAGMMIFAPALTVLPQEAFAGPAATRQNAPSASGSRVNKDAESLLRNGLPITNKEVRKLQLQVEVAGSDIRVKRIGAAVDGFKKARSTIKSDSGAMLASVRPGETDKAKGYLAAIDEDLGPAIEALSQNSGQGSVQERESLDRAIKAQATAAARVTDLEELMVPAGFKVPIPSEYSDLPALQGRATVEFTLKKSGAGEKFNIEGDLFDTATLKMVIDGYTAPLTGGNFLDLISKGFYNGMEIQRSDGFVVQTGDPEGPADGYVPPGGKEPRTIPLEISVKGDKTPMWGSTTEEDMRGYAGTVLPFQSFGALGMARTEDGDDTASSQFFWLLFDSDLTPAGKNLLDGAYACFGYTTEGYDFLKDVKDGDVIASAKIIQGKENLVLPK